MKNKAFTLLEVILAVLIIAILAGIVIPRVTYTATQAKISCAKADLRFLVDWVRTYHLTRGVWPGADMGARDINTVSEWQVYVNEGSLGGVPIDPWGTPYHYDGNEDRERTAGGSSMGCAGPNKSIDGSHNRADRTAQGDDIFIYMN